MNKFLVALALLAIVASVSVSGHVRVREPPNRSSIWRDPRFEHLNLPHNYDDDGLYCGRVHQPVEVDNCGVCGDPFSDSVPRPNENGGTFGNGVIAGNYTAGQEITLSIEFTIAHRGYFQMHLCDEIPESEACFNRNVLKFGNGETNYLIPDELPMWVETTAVLPSDIRCDHCTLRLHYRAGNNWGECEDGTEGMGCGIQETFRSCSDISIQ